MQGEGGQARETHNPQLRTHEPCRVRSLQEVVGRSSGGGGCGQSVSSVSQCDSYRSPPPLVCLAVPSSVWRGTTPTSERESRRGTKEGQRKKESKCGVPGGAA